MTLPGRAALVAVALALAGCGGGNEGGGTEGGDASAVERATRAIQDCRVRSMVSLHRGVVVLELEGGGAIEVPGSEHDHLMAEIERARPRRGNVVVAME